MAIFGYARRLFARTRTHPEFSSLRSRQLRVIQRFALCTYRDPDLPASRFADAMSILGQGDLRRDNVSNETLGLAGAIHKYQWMLNGSRRDFESARSTFTNEALHASRTTRDIPR